VTGSRREENDGTAPAARVHRQWTPLARALAAVGDRWTLLIVLELGDGPLRLQALMDRLPGASAGVLDNHVRRMREARLITRRRFREVPPRVELELTRAGAELAGIAGALARWGMRNAWSAPLEGERVDVSAILRMLPALLAEERELPDGTLEAVVWRGQRPGSGSGSGSEVYSRQAGRHVFDVRGDVVIAGPPSREESAGAAEGADREGASPGAAVGHTTAPVRAAGLTARAEGDAAAWVAALGPARDRAGLALSGDQRIAAALLDALPGPARPPG
jgi:DNA-binding HxlR family transcriptional regulator